MCFKGFPLSPLWAQEPDHCILHMALQIISVYASPLETHMKTKLLKLGSTTLRFGHLDFHLKLGFAFWRVNHNGRFRVNRQMNFAHAHFQNRWSGFAIWMFENYMMLNPFLYDFYKIWQKPFSKDCNFSVSSMK